MKTSSDETKALAVKLLAQLISAEQSEPKLNEAEKSEVLARLDELNSRLVKIESQLSADSVSPMNPANFLPSFPVFLHSSQERFALEEAADGSAKEKACRYEPGGKPCDHCAMCSSRGF